MLLQQHIQITGIIHCQTGLHIGGSTERIGIGDIDLLVIKHPLTGQPYIPGSSLKGKIRSLLEATKVNYRVETRWKDREKTTELKKTETEPCGCGKWECGVCRIFGPHKNTEHELGPTRILFRDAMLTKTWQEKFIQSQKESGVFFETKTENIINRMTTVAEHPRTIERVPSGTEFDFKLALRVFDEDTDLDSMILPFIKKGLKLLQDDYIGKSGSRGYGKIEFLELMWDQAAFQI